MPRLSSILACSALALTLALPACVYDYEPEFPVGLDDAPELDEDDELVFERELRWWVAPKTQRLRLYRRVDDSYLLLRQRWQGAEIYAWSEAELTDEGVARLGNALAVAEPDQTAPLPGEYDCTYVDALASAIVIEGERVEYLSLCPPGGLVELVRLYEDVVELMLECPGDGSWFEGEVPVVVGDCSAIE